MSCTDSPASQSWLPREAGKRLRAAPRCPRRAAGLIGCIRRQNPPSAAPAEGLRRAGAPPGPLARRLGLSAARQLQAMRQWHQGKGREGLGVGISHGSSNLSANSGLASQKEEPSASLSAPRWRLWVWVGRSTGLRSPRPDTAAFPSPRPAWESAGAKAKGVANTGQAPSSYLPHLHRQRGHLSPYDEGGEGGRWESRREGGASKEKGEKKNLCDFLDTLLSPSPSM